MTPDNYWDCLADFLEYLKKDPQKVMEHLRYIDDQAFVELQLAILETLPK